MEEEQGEGYGNEGYTVHVIQPQGAWPGVRTTPYAGHPPPKPDFAVNHFASSEERLACLSDALRTFNQNEAIRQILGGNYNNYQLAPASQRLSNRRKSSAKDNSFTVTPEGGVRLGKNIRREGEWRPDTEAGRAAYERNQKEKEELAKLDPVGYPKNGVTEWPENDDKEEGATKKKKKNKKKSKKKGKKAVQVEEEDSGSDDRLEVDELDVAEEGGLAASVDEAGVKEADAEAEMAADELELPQSAKPAVTAEFAVEDAKSAPAVDLRQAPTPEPEATHVDSEEERNKRRAEKLKKAKERKNAKKERSAKRKEAMGIFRKPHAPDAEESLLAEGGVEGGVQGDVKPAAAETSATAPDSARAKEIARNLAVAGEVQAGRISSQAVQAISIEQTALQHVQPVQIQTLKVGSSHSLQSGSVLIDTAKAVRSPTAGRLQHPVPIIEQDTTPTSAGGRASRAACLCQSAAVVDASGKHKGTYRRMAGKTIAYSVAQSCERVYQGHPARTTRIYPAAQLSRCSYFSCYAFTGETCRSRARGSVQRDSAP
jgi:hypothetical protein